MMIFGFRKVESNPLFSSNIVRLVVSVNNIISPALRRGIFYFS